MQEQILKNEEALKNWMSKDNLFDGNFYILTSNLTFSSGLIFAYYFSDNNLATVIGEVPGNSPECFGDCTEDFSLPNSHVIFHTTFKKFYRPDPTKDPVRLTPNIQVNAEEALKEVYKLISSKK